MCFAPCDNFGTTPKTSNSSAVIAAGSDCNDRLAIWSQEPWGRKLLLKLKCCREKKHFSSSFIQHIRTFRSQPLVLLKGILLTPGWGTKVLLHKAMQGLCQLQTSTRGWCMRPQLISSSQHFRWTQQELDICKAGDKGARQIPSNRSRRTAETPLGKSFKG